MSSETESLTASRRLVAAILAVLYARGVRRDSLALTQIGHAGDRFDPVLFGDALDWLRTEGIIRAEIVRSHPPLAEKAVLTARGFALIEASVDALENEPFALGMLAGASPTPPRHDGSADGLAGLAAGP